MGREPMRELTTGHTGGLPPIIANPWMTGMFGGGGGDPADQHRRTLSHVVTST